MKKNMNLFYILLLTSCGGQSGSLFSESSSSQSSSSQKPTNPSGRYDGTDNFNTSTDGITNHSSSGHSSSDHSSSSYSSSQSSSEPVINKDAPEGMANFGSLSLGFKSTAGRVLESRFNNNIDSKLEFTTYSFAKDNGPLKKDVKVGEPVPIIKILSEWGNILIEGEGIPTNEGKVPFSLQGFNLGASRPVRVTDKKISNGTSYSVTCDPEDFSQQVYFNELAKDWRTTLMYYMPGEEYYFDANNNGKFDEEGTHGFWDKNQNGVFDCQRSNYVSTTPDYCDEITFSKTNIVVGNEPPQSANSNKRLTSTQLETIYQNDWFIDLPTPFVDANENGTYDSNEKTMDNKTFEPPNGKWDNSTFIWKSNTIPVYVGTSAYALTRRYISSGNYDVDNDTALKDFMLEEDIIPKLQEIP